MAVLAASSTRPVARPASRCIGVATIEPLSSHSVVLSSTVIFFRLMKNEGICIPLLFPTMYCEFVNKGHDLSAQKGGTC